MVEDEAQDEDERRASLDRAVMSQLETFHASLDGLIELFQEVEGTSLQLEAARLDVNSLAEDLYSDVDAQHFMRTWNRVLLESIDEGGSDDLKRALQEISADSAEGSDVFALEVQYRSNQIPPLEDDAERTQVSYRTLHELMSFSHGTLYSPELVGLAVERDVYAEYMAKVNRLSMRPHNTYVLANSTVVMAVSTFEAHVSNLLRIFLRHGPGLGVGGALPSPMRYTVEDVATFGSIDAFLEQAISDHAEKFMQDENFLGWAEWWKSTLDGAWPDFSFDWDALLEAVQRRHVIMHAGGRVTAQYLDRVPNKYAELDIGQGLPISSSYVVSVIENLIAVGLLSGYNLWLKLSRDGDQIAGTMLNKSFELLLSRDFRSAERVASMGAKVRCREALRKPLWVNSLIARKEIHGVDEIREEVDKWDASASALRLQVARAALVDDFEQLAELLPRAVKAGAPSLVDVQRWPLFSSLRDDPIYLQILNELAEEEDREDAIEEGGSTHSDASSEAGDQ